MSNDSSGDFHMHEGPATHMGVRVKQLLVWIPFTVLAYPFVNPVAPDTLMGIPGGVAVAGVVGTAFVAILVGTPGGLEESE